MMIRSGWARAAALTGALALFGAALPVEAVFAQEAPSVALEQARRGEDGTSDAGAGAGNASNGKRDKDGNGGNASAGSAGDTATDGTSDAPAEAAPLPENAALLDRLGILDDVTTYGVDVLVGMDIPLELLPEPVQDAPAETAAPADVNTGGQGSSGAPASGDTNASSEDGGKADKKERKNKDGATADDGSGSTDGSTSTDSATGSDGQ